MAEQTQEARLLLQAAGCPADCFDAAVALAPQVEAAGVNWLDLLGVLVKLGANAPALIEILKKLLAQKPPTTQAPKP